jgi:proline dehydrogenase
MSVLAVKTFVVNCIPGRLVRVFAAPYVAGDSMEKGLAAADRLYQERHIMATMDVLGEAERQRDKVREAVQLYLDTLAALKDRPYCTVSVKPGHFGYYVDPQFCRENLEEMAAACQKAGRGLTIDMEDTDLTDFTLDVYRQLKPKYPVVGTVLQSRLYRTEKDVDSLAGLNAHVRLCIGIYQVPEPLAMQKKRDMKENLLKLVAKLAEGGHYVCVGTHDVEYIRKAWQVLKDMKVPQDRYEFQMLQGVPREALQKELVDAGEKVRLYLPFALHWDDAIAYLRRRMLESPSMVGLVLKNLVKRS